MTTIGVGSASVSEWGARPVLWAEQEGPQLPTYAAALRRVGQRFGSGVLDIGCGSGTVLGLAYEHGSRPFGLDAGGRVAPLQRHGVTAVAPPPRHDDAVRPTGARSDR